MLIKKTPLIVQSKNISNVANMSVITKNSTECFFIKFLNFNKQYYTFTEHNKLNFKNNEKNYYKNH